MNSTYWEALESYLNIIQDILCGRHQIFLPCYIDLDQNCSIKIASKKWKKLNPLVWCRYAIKILGVDATVTRLCCQFCWCLGGCVFKGLKYTYCLESQRYSSTMMVMARVKNWNHINKCKMHLVIQGNLHCTALLKEQK